MSDTSVIPAPLAVRNLFEDLLGRDVNVSPGDPMTAENLPTGVIAIYTDTSQQLYAVLGMTLSLAANATRFGFVQRYSWEAWHYGLASGPAPCSAAGEAVSASGGGAAFTAGSTELPTFVPVRYRDPILRSAARWGVPPALMAGQLMAESGFDPDAGSAAGAQGIAQFMPGTAAAYGLADPYDPVAATFTCVFASPSSEVKTWVGRFSTLPPPSAPRMATQKPVRAKASVIRAPST